MRLALALATALLLTGCDELLEQADYQANFHYHYDLNPGGRIEIDNMNGSVEIQGWEGKGVEVSGVKFASSERVLEALRIDVRNSPDSISIRTIHPPFHRSWANYRIRVPRQTTIERVNSINGAIEVRNLDSGPLQRTAHLKTVNGSIDAENFLGSVDAETVNGRIELRDIGGAATMRGLNGRIEAERIAGACEAHSVNGPITILLERAGDSLKASTMNGGIDLTFREKPKDAIRASTTNGSITLRMPGDAAAHLRADTAHAPISTDFELYEHLHESTGWRNHVNGIIGNGGPEIELSTTNGRISVMKTL